MYHYFITDEYSYGTVKSQSFKKINLDNRHSGLFYLITIRKQIKIYSILFMNIARKRSRIMSSPLRPILPPLALIH